ncbi:DUF3888 domain-containing protein [Microbacteriaceae bacterium 4G12]
MKKIVCAMCLSVMICVQPVFAEVSPTLIEDALYSVLFPQINQAIQKHYGIQKRYDCPKIVSLKREYPGTYVFEATIEVIKYEEPVDSKPQPPFDRILITFNNEEGEWMVKSMNVQRLPNNTKLTCQKK